jgi:LmbE family N-acetylglucosaminyl deacetylase
VRAEGPSAASGLRLLGVFAHPDDEVFCAGGTFARYAKRGVEIMVVCATRGEAGQIRDARIATRRTIGAVREQELRSACDRLGVRHVRLLDHRDGELSDLEFDSLVGEIVAAVREFRPDVLITFGPDGGYGHPDHIRISEATTAACFAAGDETRYREQLAVGLAPHATDRLYHAHFPPRGVLLMQRLAQWLVGRDARFAGSPEFGYALLLLAEQTATMRYVRDRPQVRWFPEGSYVLEQGEPSDGLFLVLSGSVEVRQEDAAGAITLLRRLGPGEFFGELGVAGQRPRSAHVVTAEHLTCLVLTPGTPELFAGRGQRARYGGTVVPVPDEVDAGPATAYLDVSEFVAAKVDALCAYRSQYSLQPEMLPEPILREIYGQEYFVQVLPRRSLDTELY